MSVCTLYSMCPVHGVNLSICVLIYNYQIMYLYYISWCFKVNIKLLTWFRYKNQVVLLSMIYDKISNFAITITWHNNTCSDWRKLYEEKCNNSLLFSHSKYRHWKYWNVHNGKQVSYHQVIVFNYMTRMVRYFSQPFIK